MIEWDGCTSLMLRTNPGIAISAYAILGLKDKVRGQLKLKWSFRPYTL